MSFVCLFCCLFQLDDLCTAVVLTSTSRQWNRVTINFHCCVIYAIFNSASWLCALYPALPPATRRLPVWPHNAISTSVSPTLETSGPSFETTSLGDESRRPLPIPYPQPLTGAYRYLYGNCPNGLIFAQMFVHWQVMKYLLSTACLRMTFILL